MGSISNRFWRIAKGSSVKTSITTVQRGAETVAIIHLPKFDSSNCSATGEQDYTRFALDSDIVSLLHDFVAKTASMYRKNPFHNFGTSSLNRIV